MTGDLESRWNMGAEYFAKIVQVMARLEPEVGNLLEGFRFSSLYDYSVHLWTKFAEPQTLISAEARSIFCAVVGEAISGPTGSSEFELTRAVERFPVIQTGFHSQLLVDPISFYTYALYAIGACAVGSEVALNYSCSTNSLQNTKFSGAGWLHHKGEPFNLFGLSRQRFDSLSVFANVPDNRWNFDRLLEARDPSLRALGLRLKGISAPAAETAFNLANVRLSDHMTGCSVKSVFFGESLVVRMLIEHLRSKKSVIRRVILEPTFRSSVLRKLRENMKDRTSELLPFGTELFWIVTGGKLRPAVIDGNEICKKNDPSARVVRLNEEDLVVALEQGSLVPSLFLTFQMIGSLPRINVLGGHRQIFYFPAMQRILAAALRETNCPQDAELARELDHVLHGWIVGLLFRDRNPIDCFVEPYGSILNEELNFSRSTFICEAVDRFPIPAVDPTWARIMNC